MNSCMHCDKLRAEVVDLKRLIANCFDKFDDRFDEQTRKFAEQDRKLTILVESIGIAADKEFLVQNQSNLNVLDQPIENNVVDGPEVSVDDAVLLFGSEDDYQDVKPLLVDSFSSGENHILTNMSPSNASSPNTRRTKVFSQGSNVRDVSISPSSAMPPKESLPDAVESRLNDEHSSLTQQQLQQNVVDWNCSTNETVTAIHGSSTSSTCETFNSTLYSPVNTPTKTKNGSKTARNRRPPTFRGNPYRRPYGESSSRRYSAPTMVARRQISPILSKSVLLPKSPQRSRYATTSKNSSDTSTSSISKKNSVMSAATSGKREDDDKLVKTTCNVCSKTFSSFHTMMRHRNVRHNVNAVMYSCPMCEKIYCRKDSLIRHCKLVHNNIT